jgi:hypothetical protein
LGKNASGCESGERYHDRKENDIGLESRDGGWTLDISPSNSSFVKHVPTITNSAFDRDALRRKEKPRKAAFGSELKREAFFSRSVVTC